MKSGIIKWLDKKKSEDSALTQFLKLGYSIGQKSWLHAIISALLGIVIPIIYDKGKFVLFGLLLVVLVVDIVYVYVCNSYQKMSYTQRKFATEILSDESSLLKSIAIEIENNSGWKNKIFKTVSDLVCEKLYRNFKEVFNCETRIAIEYIFNKSTKNAESVKHVKMAGRRSSNRATVKKSMALEKRKNYYSYKIFLNNNNGVNILSETQIQNKDIWYKNPNNIVDVKKYVGIAVDVYDEKEVKFILEIDFLDDFIFGDNNDDMDIKKFIEQYLMAYINVINIAYLLNLNNKKEIPEV